MFGTESQFKGNLYILTAWIVLAKFSVCSVYINAHLYVKCKHKMLNWVSIKCERERSKTVCVHHSLFIPTVCLAQIFWTCDELQWASSIYIPAVDTCACSCSQRASASLQEMHAGWAPGGWGTSLQDSSRSSQPCRSGSCPSLYPCRRDGLPSILPRGPVLSKTRPCWSTNIRQMSPQMSWRWPKVNTE